jgi:hypothetical protein
MKLVTPNSIKDFKTCSLLFKYRHEEQLSETIGGRDLLSERFENTIKDIVYFFFYKKQGGYTPSYASLLNRWEKLWFSKDISAYDIMTEQHESAYGNNASLTSKAANILLSFHEHFSDSAFIPIAINEEFIFPISKDVKIKDKFDVILYKDNSYYVIKLMFNYKNNHQHMNQIDFTTIYSAFAHKNPTRISKLKVGYCDLASQNAQFSEYEILEDDINSLKFWCDEIFNTEKFIPRRGLTWYCKKCPFDTPCSKWKPEKKNING